MNIQLLSGRSDIVTSGTILPESNIAVVGCNSGRIIIVNLKNQKINELILKGAGRINSIAVNDDGNVLVVTREGGIFILQSTNPQIYETVLPPKGSPTSTLWTGVWTGENQFHVGGTYGKFRMYNKINSGWTYVSLTGHSHSVFGLDFKVDRVLSGDYRGILTFRGSRETTGYSTSIGEGIQGIRWSNQNSFVVVTKMGSSHFFELRGQSKNRKFSKTSVIDLTTTEATCAEFSEDGNTIFIGTHSEVIQFDLEKNHGSRIDINNVVAMKTHENSLFILTTNRLLEIDVTEVKIEIDSVEFQQIKITILGHTGSGKSTLCRRITTGVPGNEQSTFGRKVWTWIPETPDKRVVFHDYGGQEAVIATFIPFIGDSDIVLILFKRTEFASIQKGLRMLDDVRSVVPLDVPIIFVETWIDQRMDATQADTTLEEYLADGRISSHVRVCPTQGETVEDLADVLISKINWNEASIMIRSKAANEVRSILRGMRNTGIKISRLTELAEKYNEETGDHITEAHLGFILRTLSNEGVVEYFPNIVDYVIVDDPDFNDLRTTIPIFVHKNRGVVEIADVQKEYSQFNEYVLILDEIYSKFDFCVRNNTQRIFPQLLRDGSVIVPPKIKDSLETNTFSYSGSFQKQKRVSHHLAQGLSRNNLYCIDMTNEEALFRNEKGTVMHYRTFTRGGGLSKKQLVIEWTIGGADRSDCSIMNRFFESVLESVLGPPLATPIRYMIQKDESDTVEFKESLNSEYSIARAISAFGNTNGGNLIIGVKKDRTIAGVEMEYPTLTPPNQDGFELRVKEVIKSYLGDIHLRVFSARFEEIENHDVCHIFIDPSPKPIFLQKNKEGKRDVHFVYRAGNASQRIDGNDMLEYIKTSWPEGS